ncbi:hypothetical protein LCGC14_1653290 [marine sediment metagenome]|uniref:Uncharacterized protein n=1 Tax=marine sediment metagenome TaxID=412755 RepID=A0A0F9HX03_9ZZZZ
MGLWLLFFILLLGICTFFLWKVRQKEKIHETNLIANNTEFQSQIKQLKEEKASIEAKYLKKLKAAETKKKNLAKYRRKKKNIRKRKKSIAEEAEEIVGKGASWLPHSREGSKSHKIGKPKGSPGGGRKRPEKIHEEKELHVHKCYNCGTNLDGVKEYVAYDRVVTELFRYQEDEKDYLTLRLKNVKLIIKRKKCPKCKKWVYPEQDLLKNNRIGLLLVSFVMSGRIRTGLPYKVIIYELSTHFGSNFAITAPAIINRFKNFSEIIEG